MIKIIAFLLAMMVSPLSSSAQVLDESEPFINSSLFYDLSDTIGAAKQWARCAATYETVLNVMVASGGWSPESALVTQMHERANGAKVAIITTFLMSSTDGVEEEINERFARNLALGKEVTDSWTESFEVALAALIEADTEYGLETLTKAVDACMKVSHLQEAHIKVYYSMRMKGLLILPE